ncbi:MFS transporter, partial [Pseudonocardia pini]|uniref:MFS transporter n=1 Tax=Pseudonocardia pini TaxID=2758030 RepID=UPI0015F09A59
MSAPPRLGAGTSAGYASGSLVTGAFSTVPGLLLLPYLTDTLGVAAGLAGVLAFVPKAWAVLLNPVAGRVSDRSTARIGPRRPFVLGAGLGVGVAFALMFAGPFAAAAGAVWALLGYLLTATVFAFFQSPYTAMPAEMTTDPGATTRLMSWRV